MHTYARVYGGVVVEIITPATDQNGNEIPVAERFTPEFIDTLVDISSTTPMPGYMWTYREGEFEAPIA